MSFLLWQSSGPLRVASPRLVLRADEVPVLQDAEALRARMQQMHAEAHRRLDAASAEARAKGEAEGREAGLRAVRDELARGLQTLAVQAERERDQLRGELAALALQVVRKMLGDFADTDKLLALAATAARESLPAAPLRLAVAPAQADAVRDRLAAARSAGAAPGTDATLLQCEVVGDATLADDECRLETAYGSVDASLESQLARLAAAWGVEQAA